MGGRPCPSTSEVTQARPRREEWPYPGSCGRHASRRQRSAARNAAGRDTQRNLPAHESTQHTVQQNNPKQCTTTMAADSHTTCRKHQHQPNTQRLVWGPHPPHGHCTHAQPPPPTNRARAQVSKASPGGSDSAPPMGGRPYPSTSEVTRTRPPRGGGGRPCLGSRGRHASQRQRSGQRGGNIAHNAAQQAKAGRGTQ